MEIFHVFLAENEERGVVNRIRSRSIDFMVIDWKFYLVLLSFIESWPTQGPWCRWCLPPSDGGGSSLTSGSFESKMNGTRADFLVFFVFSFFFVVGGGKK